MNLGQISIEDRTINELVDLTESMTPIEAIDKAIKFTLMHDKDGVRDALFELVTKQESMHGATESSA